MLAPGHFSDDFKRGAARRSPRQAMRRCLRIQLRGFHAWSTWSIWADPPTAGHIAESLPKKPADSSSMSA